MRKPNSHQIQQVSWLNGSEELILIREQVFIKEQLVPIELEWDGMDETAIHLLATDADQNPVGCARILAGGTIGRMAVLNSQRGKGFGMALLMKAIEICQQHSWNTLSLSAQTHAISFYRKAGFVVSSDEYLDAGIPHVDMQLKLFH